jgi:small subunit ribosomal protein S18
MCYFCQKNIEAIDYKNVEQLTRYVSGFYKIKGKKKTGLCSKHQRKIAVAIKRARQLGMMPYLPA